MSKSVDADPDRWRQGLRNCLALGLANKARGQGQSRHHPGLQECVLVKGRRSRSEGVHSKNLTNYFII